MSGYFDPIRRWILKLDPTAKAVADALETWVKPRGVAFSDLPAINTDRLLGRDTSGIGDIEEINVGPSLTFTGTGFLQRAALTGDITAAANSNATTIANDAVTYAKMQNVSAASRLLGRGSAGGAGDPQEISLGPGLAMSGTTLNTSLTSLGWFNVKDYGAVGNGSTDDTSAIQSAITACATAGGGTVYFPRGVYIVGGALQDTSRSNAQLLLPILNVPSDEAITVVLRGEAPPPMVVGTVTTTPLPDNLSVIKGTLNTASGTAPCLIGAHGPSGSASDFTDLYLGIYDLAIQMPADPALTAVDASHIIELDVDNVLIHTGQTYTGAISAQSTSTSYGLRTPANNNAGLTRIGLLNVVGFYNGIEVNEHTVGQDVGVWACRQACVFPFGNHASRFERLMAVWCQRGLVFTGAHYTSIAQFNLEHAASGTWVPVYDVDDASNYAIGRLWWHVVKAGVGPDTTFLTNGAANLTIRKLSKDYISGTPTAGRLAKWNDSQSLTDTTLSAFLDGEIGSTRGAVLYRGASGWAILAPGTSGTFLKSNGSGADPSYDTPTSSSTFLPLVTGAEPPVLVSDGNGHLIAVGYTP